MVDLEYTQYFDDFTQPNVVPPDSGHFSLIMKVTNLLRKEGTSQIMIHPIQCMFTFHDINYKILMAITSKKILVKEKLFMVQ